MAQVSRYQRRQQRKATHLEHLNYCRAWMQQSHDGTSYAGGVMVLRKFTRRPNDGPTIARTIKT